MRELRNGNSVKLIEKVETVLVDISEWARILGEIQDTERFATDVVGQLLKFASSIEKYEAIIARRKAKEKRNYLYELDAAIESTEATLNTVFEPVGNPLFDSQCEEETKKYRNMSTEILLFLLDKRTSLYREYSEYLEYVTSRLTESYELLSSATFKHGGNLEALRELEELETLYLEEGKKQIELEEKDLYFEKKSNRSDLRLAFVANTAQIYCAHTGRRNINRNSNDKSRKRKNPFNLLMEICFEATDERVNSDALTKLKAQINSAKI